MPWDIFRQVSFANLRMVSPTIHPLDNEQLEVTLLEPQKFRDVKSEDTTLPLQELLEWVAQHPFTGYKGGIARLVAKILWLDAENPDLQSEIQGFNDIDLIYFLQDGDEQQKTSMKKLVDDGLTIGGIPVEAQDVEYSYDTIPHVLATRDLTQNQCIIVSDASGRVFLITAQVCRQHMLQSKTAPAVASDNSTLDDYGNVVAKPRAVGRAIIQWMKGRASTVELNDATVKFYRKQKLPKMTLFQVFNKAKGNEMYMKVYTELLRLGFVEHQQFPHALWGDCYCYVNSLIARHGYRLELESDLDSAAVEKWKEAKYAEQLARTRISIFRDFRFHRMVLDETFLMPYEIADTPLTAGLKERAHGWPIGASIARAPDASPKAPVTNLDATGRRLTDLLYHAMLGDGVMGSHGDGTKSDLSKRHLASVAVAERALSKQPGTTFRLGGSEAADSASRLVRQAAHEKGKAKAAERLGRAFDRRIIQRILSSGGAYLEQDDLPDDQRDPLLNQNMFGKLTMTETFLHLLRVVKIAWVQFLLSFLVNLFAAVLFVLVINHMASAFWLLAAFASNALGAWLFIRASNCALLNVLSSMFLALLNLRADAFSTRLFSEVWSRLVGDTRALQGVLESCSDFTIEALTAIGALFVLLFSMEPSCDNSIWSTMLVVVSTGTGMAAISMLAGFSLRSSSRMSRSMIGYLYSYMLLGRLQDLGNMRFSSLSNFFETKFIPEQFAATTSAYEEIQSASLEQRKKLTLIHQVVSIFLRVTEFAALTQALYRLVHSSSTDASCLHSYSIQAMSIPILLSAVRRASEACLQLFSSVGSLERLFLLSRALLRFSTPRFDGINHFAAERISMEIPHDFNVSLGSPQFGPFARIPALPEVKVGKLNVLAMARGQGASTLAKILLRIVDAPARIKIDGEHVEQYEQETLNFAIHVVDHPPLASSVARTAGQGQSLTEYVQLGLEDNGMGLPLDVCLHRAGIWSQVANIPHGIECTEWSSYMTKPEAYRVQLARALFRASLGTLRMRLGTNPLECCSM
ncbi:unnamed protein product [Cladocopium goreaui]|uniref:THUMP domain-containing protein 2 n=1 Tax=Cladocopium goreaui TaxID=2562237 RepID=A0A9P1CZK0_9DINO|nr:unnamed protein product [Cladocopium goreaui]